MRIESAFFMKTRVSMLARHRYSWSTLIDWQALKQLRSRAQSGKSQ